ncbi:MAG: hypothetical protein J7J98_00865 [candidate division Zixibacteria bacterium]|nr:hypothetical protein [candidate division Zixibacteria bacterium]
MRSSKSLFLAGCLTVLALVLVGFGCSDDVTTTVIPEEDNGIESRLEEVSSQVNAHIDSVIAVVESGLRVATFIDIGTGDIGGAFMGSVLPDSTMDDNNWIVSWATDLQAGLGTLNIVDSLTYIVGGALSVNAKDATEMHVKHNYNYTSSDSTVSFTDIDNNGNLHFDGIDGNTATVNGTVRSVVIDKDVSTSGTIWNDWTLETSVSNLAVTKSSSSWTNGCPETGTAVISVEHRYAENLDVPVTTNWEMTVTFTNGNAVVDVVTGQLSTSYENSFCTP